MSANLVRELLQRADALTLEEQLRLATQLIDRARERCSGAITQRSWRELDGAAPGLLSGNDAQEWVSRGRREADEGRDRRRRRSE